MEKGVISGNPQMKISLSEPLKVHDEFSVSVTIGTLSGDLRDFTEPFEVWIVSTQHFEIENGDRTQCVKKISADEIKTGLSEVAFKVRVMLAEDRTQPRIQVFFNYNYRPCGKIERVLTIIAD